MAKSRFSRERKIKETGRKIVVLCEGSKTEVNYFEGIRKSLRLPSVRILVVHPDATDPLSIVRAAVAHRAELISQGRWIDGDTAWAVFDGDEHIQSNPKNWNDAIQLAKHQDVGLAISNPSFELWYLLHYRPQTANLTRQSALAALRRFVPKYQKNVALFPDPLRPLTKTAMTNAVNLQKRNKANGLAEFSNPCTCVQKLLSVLEDIHSTAFYE